MLKKSILLFSLILVFVLAGIWVGRFHLLKFYYQKKWEARSPERTIERIQKDFLEDRAILSKYDVFKPSKGTRDAGPFLNPKLHWQIGEIHHRGDLVLPEFVHKELTQDWIKKRPLFKKMGLDFSWMKELHKYDFWNPEQNSPAYPKGKKYSTYTFPVPTYRDLLTWAKLRLLYGNETGDLVSAFKDVRQLTRLIWTNDYLISSLVAVKMLRLETEIHSGNWEIISEDHLLRAKRHFYVLPQALDLRVSDETFSKMASTELGICPMVVESMMMTLSLRELLKEEQKAKFERIDHLARGTEGKCRRTIIHEMWDDPDPRTDQDSEIFQLLNDSDFPRELMTYKEFKNNEKLMKAILGYSLGDIATPNSFGGYEK